MAEPLHLIGSSDQTIPLFLQGITGAGQPGLVAADLACWFYRRRSAPVQIVLSDLAAVDSAHGDGGIIEVDATNMPGHYRLDLPDAVAAEGSPFGVVVVTGANILSCNVQLPLWSFNDVLMSAMAKELLNTREHDEETGLHTIYGDDGVTPFMTISLHGAVEIAAANWTNASKYLIEAGAFTNYRWRSGDAITLTAGTGVVLGQYEIASKVDDDTIELADDINGTGGDVADGSIAGLIAHERVLCNKVIL